MLKIRSLISTIINVFKRMKITKHENDRLDSVFLNRRLDSVALNKYGMNLLKTKKKKKQKQKWHAM